MQTPLRLRSGHGDIPRCFIRVGGTARTIIEVLTEVFRNEKPREPSPRFARRGKYMSIKERIIDDINKIKPEMLPVIYGFIKRIENTTDTDTDIFDIKYKNISHKDVQRALCTSDTTWSEDLTLERDERI